MQKTSAVSGNTALLLQKRKRRIRDNVELYALLFPVLLHIFIFSYIPLHENSSFGFGIKSGTQRNFIFREIGEVCKDIADLHDKYFMNQIILYNKPIVKKPFFYHAHFFPYQITSTE